MTILLSWLCWGACQEEVCLDPRFLCNLTPPRLTVELPIAELVVIYKQYNGLLPSSSHAHHIVMCVLVTCPPLSIFCKFPEEQCRTEIALAFLPTFLYFYPSAFSCVQKYTRSLH